jgi:hypothetical protein
MSEITVKKPKLVKTTMRMERHLAFFLEFLSAKHGVSKSKLMRLAIEKAYASQLAQYNTAIASGSTPL